MYVWMFDIIALWHHAISNGNEVTLTKNGQIAYTIIPRANDITKTN